MKVPRSAPSSISFGFSETPIAGFSRRSIGRVTDDSQEYPARTAVERVNSRLDVSFGFEWHTIRGLKKMRWRCGLALVVMLAMALGRIRVSHADQLRSLVRPAI